jgi:hypothetical protein
MRPLKPLVSLSGCPRSFSVLIVSLFAVLVVVGASTAAPKPGKYTGKTSEAGGTVSFTVSANGTSVTGFTTSDGQNGQCHFKVGIGGIPYYTVDVAMMTIAKTGMFAATVKESNRPFPGTGTMDITGKLAGARASGTLNVPADKCGSQAEYPSRAMYLETFTATNG